MLNWKEGQHYRTHQIVFYRLFYDGGEAYVDLNMERYKHIFQLMKKEEEGKKEEEDKTPETLLEFVQWSVNNYYKFLPEF